MSAQFDTLHETVALENAGVERAHAQAVVRTIANSRVDLATKDDIRGIYRYLSVHLAVLLAILGIVAVKLL